MIRGESMWEEMIDVTKGERRRMHKKVE